MTAPPALEVRDTLAFGLIFTRLLAFFGLRAFSRRRLKVNLTSALIAFGLRFDRHPRACRGCCVAVASGCIYVAEEGDVFRQCEAIYHKFNGGLWPVREMSAQTL